MKKPATILSIIVVDPEVFQVGRGSIFVPGVTPCPTEYWFVPTRPKGGKRYLKLRYGKDTFVEMVSEIDGAEAYLRIVGHHSLVPLYFSVLFEPLSLSKISTVSLRQFYAAKRNVKSLMNS